MTLVDAGPLLALVDRSDRHHAWAAETLASLRGPLATVWPALTEVFFQLPEDPRAAAAVWTMVERGAVRIAPLDESDAPRMRELMTKYADLPMDLADAALVRVAERDAIRAVFTTDRKNFSVYRMAGGKRLAFVG